MSTRPDRFSRLLAMVPYFARRRGIAMSQAAKDLGITERQLTKDLELLFLCGLPGHFPDDLIDLQFEHGHVEVGFTAGMDRPLRLTGTEASTMLIALQALLDLPGTVDQRAARRAMAKIEAAVGSGGVSVPGADARRTTEEAASPVIETIREAVKSARALSIRYYTPGRDRVSERIVDPVRLQTMDDHTYLDAWCRQADGMRLFRLDRVEDAVLLDEPAAPPDPDAVRAPSGILSGDDQGLPSVEIEIDPEELWILDYYLIEPLELVADRPDPALPVRARIAYGSAAWLTRFVLGFGGSVRLCSDDQIDQAVKATAHAARERYT